MSKHPSVKPTPPRKPPVVSPGGKRESGEDAQYGARNLLKSSPEHHTHPHTRGTADMDMRVHGHGDHKSQFATKENGVPAGKGFAKPGTDSGAGY